MMRVKLLMVFVVSTIAYCALATTVVGPQEDPPESPCYSDRELTDCVNNHCVRRFCDEAEPGPDCKFEGTCERGCLCKKGFLKDRFDKCVPEDQCTNPISCTGDKVFTECINGGCGRFNCTQLRGPQLCIDFAPGGCDPGCACKNNKLLTASGDCVPANECPANEVCPGPHQVFDTCLSTCPSLYCPGLVNTDDCPPQPKPGDPDCQPGCGCEEGYYKTQSLECVALEDCPSPYEY